MKAQANKLPGVALCTLFLVVVAAGCSGGGAVSGLPGNSGTLQLKTPLASPTPTPRIEGATPEFVYVANNTSQTVSEYVIDVETGALASVAGSPIAAGIGPWGLTVDPSGRFVYVASNDVSSSASVVSAYSLNATTGALTPVPGSPFLSDHGCGYPAIDPSTKFAYVSCYDNSQLAEYTVDGASGGLTLTGLVRTIPSPNPGASDVVVDPTGRFVYVPNNIPFPTLGSVSAYTINATTGALTPVPGSPFPAGNTAWVAAIDPSGKFLYVTNDNPSSDSVSAYTIDRTSGALTLVPGAPFPAGTNPGGIAVDPLGKYVFVANFSSNNVESYTINPSTGALTSVGTFPTGSGPFGVAVDLSSRFVYVTNQNDNTISAYSIDLASGVLAPVGTFATGTTPLGVAVGGPVAPGTHSRSRSRFGKSSPQAQQATSRIRGSP